MTNHLSAQQDLDGIRVAPTLPLICFDLGNLQWVSEASSHWR